MTILDKIVSAKHDEIAAARAVQPASELRAAVADAPPIRDFTAAISGGGSIRLIAEVKKASPSKGVICEDFRPLDVAHVYHVNGASCLSVLTDQAFFQGSLQILRSVRGAVPLPVLRKDFILDPYQLLEARAAGADAVLLIAECLPGDQLRRLHDAASELGMAALVELYDRHHLARVLDTGTALVGINNRDLRTFQTKLDHTIQLRREIPADRCVVGESGIHGRADALRLEQAQVHAMLVGEHLMSAPDIGAAVRALLGQD